MSTTQAAAASRTVGTAVAEALGRAGVKVAFTVPGESILGILEGLAANRIRIVTTRHEGSAAFMADAVGQLTGRLAVCLAGRAPGAANLAVGLHAARQDSAPVLAIVGQVRRDVLGREAFQELDLVRTFEPIVKWAVEIHDAEEAPAIIERAIATATRGRPGPVLVSIPEDVVDLPVSEAPALETPAREARPEPDPTLVRKVLHLLADARRPVILAGAGVLRARSSDALARFAEVIQVPVVAAWRRPDVFANDHPLYIGMAGLGAPANVRARLEEADALLVLGCRLNEFTTFGYEVPAEHTRWAHVDLEPRGVGHGRRPPDLAMAADVAGFLRVARRVLAGAAFDAASFDARRAANVADRAAYEAASVVDAFPWDGPGVHPGRIVAALGRELPAEAIVTTDAGDFALWAARGYRYRRPGTFLGPTSGSMGYGLPSAIAASVARPGRVAVAMSGDGGFAMTMAELETAVRERAHVVALVFDNSRYGTIHRHQARRGSAAGPGTDLGHVDFAAVANALGAVGLTVRSDEEFEPAFRKALEAGRPAVLHLLLDRSWSTPDRAPLPEGETSGRDAQAADSAALVEAPDVFGAAEAGEGVDLVDVAEAVALVGALDGSESIEVVETIEVVDAKTAEPLETIEVVETVALVEPAELAELGDFGEPAEPAESLEPADLLEPAEFGEPAESVESFEPSDVAGAADALEGPAEAPEPPEPAEPPEPETDQPGGPADLASVD